MGDVNGHQCHKYLVWTAHPLLTLVAPALWRAIGGDNPTEDAASAATGRGFHHSWAFGSRLVGGRGCTEYGRALFSAQLPLENKSILPPAHFVLTQIYHLLDYRHQIHLRNHAKTIPVSTPR
jgi:hypothetical protein